MISFSSKYNYYDGNKYEGNYLYNTNRFSILLSKKKQIIKVFKQPYNPVHKLRIFSDLLGQWKHYNLSADTLNFRKPS